MRVLLDENTHQGLVPLFEQGIEVVTVAAWGRRGRRNGELLQMAQQRFDAFVTMDGGIPHQQNLRGIALGIVLIEARSNRYGDLAPLMERVNLRYARYSRDRSCVSPPDLLVWRHSYRRAFTGSARAAFRDWYPTAAKAMARASRPAAA
jgi:hypothetical protein